MTYDDEWGRAAEVGGEFVKPAQLNGHLVIVYPIGYIPFIQTRFSGQGGKPSDGIAVDVVDLDDKNEQGLPGKVYRNSNFMQAHLIAALKSQIGSKVLGMISQGVAKNGMNAPWVIIDMSGDPTARERGSAWLAANPNFQASPFVLREQRPIEPMYNPAPAAPYRGPSSFQHDPAPQQFTADNRYGGTTQYQAPAPTPPPPPQYAQPQQQYVQPQQQYQQPAPQQPVQQPAQYRPQPQYVPVAGSPQVSQEEMTVLQQHRAMRAAAEAEAARQASFNDEPPF